MSKRTRTLGRANRLLTLSLLPALLAVLLLPLQAAAVPNGYLVFNEYPTGASTSPFDIRTGPDGNIWYTEVLPDLVIKANPMTGATISSTLVNTGVLGCNPTGLTIGPDGNMWTACFSQELVARITTAGAVTKFPLPAASANNIHNCGCPEFLTAGPDGFVWFSEVGAGYIAKLKPSTGSLYEYPLPSGANSFPRVLTVGPDGNIWFTEDLNNKVGYITPSGSITEFTVPTANAFPFGLTTGPDGNLYFTEIGLTGTSGKIGRISTSGVITEFTVPTASSGPRLITVGPDGNLWFAERDSAKIGSMTPSGVFQDIAVLTASSSPFGVASGPDGNLWFTEEGTPPSLATNGAIGKVGARHNALFLDKTAIGFGTVQLGTATGTQRVTITNTGPDPLPAFTPTISTATATSGVFLIAAQTCSAGLIAVSGTCYADVRFNATLVAGNATGTLSFPTSMGATAQTLTAGLTATVIAAACSSTAITTDLPSPQNVGATVTLSATSAGCPNPSPLYKFLIRGLDGVWVTVKDFSTTASFVWNTTTYARGTYLIGVWVKDAMSVNTYDAYAFGTFTLALPSCSSTNIVASVASPQVVGTTITFTSSSIGCPSPLYQWWVRDTAGNWSIVAGHDFAHSTTTFVWNTTGLAEGTYQVGVWAKQTGSVSSYDAFAFVTYTLTITHCPYVNLGTSVPSPQATGTSITLTPAVTVCPSPQYRFYVRDNSGVWHIVQDFGVGTTYVWNNASTPVSTANPGTFLLGVWAKQTGSQNAYDAFAFITFSLTSGTTCTVNIAADKTSPQALGTSATWTATANNCPTVPLSYQFWVNPPNGTWTIVQPFSNANTYAWTGATAGTYQVGVWIKQAGSTKSYDNFAFTTFTLIGQACGSVGVTSDVASPQMVGATVTFTAAANNCSLPQYQWWIRDTSATWAIAKTYAQSSATLVWNTTGLAPGTYLVGVWARQTGSTASYEAYSFITYTLTVPAAGGVCSSVGITPSVPSPQTLGTTITFTAAALGCGTPNYRFFIAPPGTSNFQQVQAYGTANTFVWTTTGLNLGPGAYQIGVWARQSGSTASYEAFAFITYQLVLPGAPCTTVAFWPTHGGVANDITSQPPQPLGLTVGLTASAAGCSAVEFQFYIAAPGASFVLAQPYGTVNTGAWYTPGLPAGTYRILVLARQQNAARAYDVYAVMSYELT